MAYFSRKVKLIETECSQEFENLVNDFLDENNDKKYNIKYQITKYKNEENMDVILYTAIITEMVYDNDN